MRAWPLGTMPSESSQRVSRAVGTPTQVPRDVEPEQAVRDEQDSDDEQAEAPTRVVRSEDTPSEAANASSRSRAFSAC